MVRRDLGDCGELKTQLACEHTHDDDEGEEYYDEEDDDNDDEQDDDNTIGVQTHAIMVMVMIFIMKMMTLRIGKDDD